MSVQRWDFVGDYATDLSLDPDGEYVLYYDHARIVAAERAKNMPWTCGKDGTLNPYGFACIECIRLAAYEQGKADAEQAHAAALAEAVDEGRKFVLAIWDDGYNVEQRMAAAFRKGQETAAPRTLTDEERSEEYRLGWEAGSKPRTLTADSAEPAVGSVVLDKFGTAWQRFAEGWCCADGRTGQTWAWVCAVGPVRLIHDGEATP